MRIGQWDTHPAADLMPMMADERLAELVESVRVNGLRQPIVLFGGTILDGRNRAKACLAVDVQPKTVEFTGGDPWAYVWDLNAERRDLEPFQRAALAIKYVRASDEWKADQARRREEANRARSEAATKQHEVSNPRRGEKSGPGPTGPTPKPNSEKSGAGYMDPKPEPTREKERIAPNREYFAVLSGVY